MKRDYIFFGKDGIVYDLLFIYIVRLVWFKLNFLKFISKLDRFFDF